MFKKVLFPAIFFTALMQTMETQAKLKWWVKEASSIIVYYTKNESSSCCWHCVTLTIKNSTRVGTIKHRIKKIAKISAPESWNLRACKCLCGVRSPLEGTLTDKQSIKKCMSIHETNVFELF